MDHTRPSITSTVDALEAAFDGRWGIWLSDTGHWWASCRASLSAADLAAGCVPFLRADTFAELTGLIQEQEALTRNRSTAATSSLASPPHGSGGGQEW